VAEYLRYRDLDLDLRINPSSGDIILLKDADAVKRSIRNLVFLAYLEYPYHPEFNAGVRALMFENDEVLLSVILTEKIKEVIEKHEKRAEVSAITVDDSSSDTQLDDNTIRVIVQFYVVNIPVPVTVDVILERIR
jgi:phage baseplate assembly protein W